jgi:hypothetical protein
LLREETGSLGGDCSAFWTTQQKQHPELVGINRGRQDEGAKRRPKPRRRNRNP